MNTEERIVDAFLRLVAERGVGGVTTRAVAREAGVNEVTVFRRFGDKATLAREAFARADPSPLLDGDAVRVDPSSPERAAEGLAACLRHLRGVMVARPHAIALPAAVNAARAFVERALLEARLQLRPEVDVRAAATTLAALVFATAAWQREPSLELTEREWDRLLESAVRPLLRGRAL